jgi:hypothetical protein
MESSGLVALLREDKYEDLGRMYRWAAGLRGQQRAQLGLVRDCCLMVLEAASGKGAAVVAAVVSELLLPPSLALCSML